MQKRFSCISLKNKIIVMKKIFIALTAIALFMSCKNENKKESVAEWRRVIEEDEKPKQEEDANKSGIAADINDQVAPQETQAGKTKEDQKLPQIKQDWDKKIIKTANLNLEIKDYNAYNTSLRDKL